MANPAKLGEKKIMCAENIILTLNAERRYRVGLSGGDGVRVEGTGEGMKIIAE